MKQYIIRDAAGTHVATHCREDGPDGKRMWWERPDGTLGLGDLKLSELPCYMTELVALGDVDDWVWVVEGERSADALVWVGELALATVTGAASSPKASALAVAAGRKFICWPDNDKAGYTHMTKTGHALLEAGARAVRFIDYQPATVDGTWGKGTDAADVIAPFALNTTPETLLSRQKVALAVLETLVEEWAADLPLMPIPTIRPRTTVPTSGQFGSVSDALIARYGIERAAPGRNVRCPKHDDRQASLSILKDDERAICKSPVCEWSGRGVIASDVLA